MILAHVGGHCFSLVGLVGAFHSFENTLDDDFNYYVKSNMCYLFCVCVTLKMIGEIKYPH